MRATKIKTKIYDNHPPLLKLQIKDWIKSTEHMFMQPPPPEEAGRLKLLTKDWVKSTEHMFIKLVPLKEAVLRKAFQKKNQNVGGRPQSSHFRN